jgi:pectinesterase
MHLQSIVLCLVLFFCTAAWAKTITVAADGSGDFKTVQEAVTAVPDNADERTILHIRPGTYEGQIIIPKSKSKVTFEGDGVDKTFITYHFNTNEPNPPGVPRFYWGTGVVVLSADFAAHNLTFENESGDHGQALALRIDGDRAVVTDCHLVGWQDTLMVNTGRQFFRNDYITGRVDFIYGSATAVFQDCEIHSRNGGHVTAASTPQDHPYGLVFMNCKLTGDSTPWDPATTNPASTVKPRVTPLADLGRPWRPYGSVTFINCEMGSHISPAGWNNWGKADNEKTARYAEYNSTGPGGNSDKRVPWSKQLTKEEADKITIDAVLDGSDQWKPE